MESSDRIFPGFKYHQNLGARFFQPATCQFSEGKHFSPYEKKKHTAADSSSPPGCHDIYTYLAGGFNVFEEY